jgi:hypothetical protein
MAYFAKLGTGNIVENVISINNTVSWILNEDTCRWEAPIPSPASYINEENKLVQEEFTL